MGGLDIEYEVVPFWQWLIGRPAGPDGVTAVPSALLSFAVTALVLLGIGLVTGYITAAIAHGPVKGLKIVARNLLLAVKELFRISPRRVLGLTMLAMREAFRRRVWVALIVFALILMFAGWFLNPDSDQPAVLYLNFVLSATTYLMLPVVVIMGAFSLPTDIKNRTIYTISTKPVRASEIVLGRILGFVAMATMLLFVMGIASYAFVSRGLNHTHELNAEELVEQREQRKVVRYSGKTSLSRRHRHEVNIEATQFTPELELESRPDVEGLVVTRVGGLTSELGLAAGDMIETIDGQAAAGTSRDAAIGKLRGRPGTEVELGVRRRGELLSFRLVRTVAETQTETNKGHKHSVTARWDPDSKQLTYQLGPPEGLLSARVPLYGRLAFIDRQGQQKQRGISVGKVYTYRSYIQGNTPAAAVWTFEGLDANAFPNGLPLDVNIRVYRSHKGEVEEGIAGSIVLRNPETGIRSRERIFTAREFTVDRFDIPLKLKDNGGQPIDLFKDLVTTDGKVQVWLRCMDPGQYFGMAGADVYIRARDGSYALNFVKGMFGIWMQLTLVIALAVLFSTFLSGPIAMLLTITTVLLGFFKTFLNSMITSVLQPDQVEQIAGHERYFGGGPLEATYRIFTQQNLTVKLDDNFLIASVKFLDRVLLTVLDKVLALLPNFEQFDEVTYLSHGYNINGSLVLQHIATTLAFVLAAYVIGYFLLKRRELAA